LKYSRSYQTIVLGTQNGVLAKVAIVAEKQDEEDDENNYQKDKAKKVLEVPL
jgi:predicted KAP-like P-loop ATPase